MAMNVGYCYRNCVRVFYYRTKHYAHKQLFNRLDHMNCMTHLVVI